MATDKISQYNITMNKNKFEALKNRFLTKVNEIKQIDKYEALKSVEEKIGELKPDTEFRENWVEVLKKEYDRILKSWDTKRLIKVRKTITKNNKENRRDYSRTIKLYQEKKKEYQDKKKANITRRLRSEFNKIVKDINENIRKYKALKKADLEEDKKNKRQIQDIENLALSQYSITIDVCDVFDRVAYDAQQRKTARRKKALDTITIDGITYKILYKNLKLIVITNEKTAKKFRNRSISSDSDDWAELQNIVMASEQYRKKYDFLETQTSLEFKLINIKHLEKKNNNVSRPTEESLHDCDNNNSIYFKYIDYELNYSATTFNELFVTEKEEIQNSCFVDLIVKTYRDEIVKRTKRDSRKNKANEKNTFDAEKLCELCGIRYKKDNIGLSLKKSVKFFEKYKLGLRATLLVKIKIR